MRRVAEQRFDAPANLFAHTLGHGWMSEKRAAELTPEFALVFSYPGSDIIAYRGDDRRHRTTR